MDTVTKSDWHMDMSRHQSSIIMKTTMTEPASFSSLIGRPADRCELIQQSTSSVTETVSCGPRNSNITYSCPVNGTSLETKASLPCQELNNRVDRKGSSHDCCFYMGSSFKPTGYINYYVHGDFAASAAASLAILSSEENHVESRSSNNHRKVLCASVTLQVKAFSSVATRFFWPNMEKKLIEVPRERCSWCFSCKAPVASKRGCLLNAAASNAIRGSIKVLAGVRPVKNGDGRLSGIATYILFMEESLSGLLVGPFLNDTFRKQWRKQVEQATTCNAMKILLLELEENIRTIALSGDWTKIVEGSSTQSSISQIAASAAGSTQKRRPGRRGKKPSAMAEVVVDGCQDKLADFTWWRGGRLSKLMFRRGILPCSVIKKSARQGGKKIIPGIHYVEGNETPKSSRQFVWRSAVEMSRNTAHLALQVRCLDFHVRWGDLVRSEQSQCDGKGPEAEAYAFRNAFICDKKLVEHEIRYSVDFGSQKHLPSRVMKNISEPEQILGDGKERYWFSESYVPLYLIKEYEQKVEQNKPVNVLPKLRRRQLKAFRRSIFSDLLWKQDNNMVRSHCCSCRLDVFYRNAVKCSECQGFCHEQCATSSSVNKSNEVEFLITCKKCEKLAAARVQSSNGSPMSPLLLQGRDFPNPSTATKHSNPSTTTKRVKLVGHQVSSAPVKEHSSEVKSTNRSAVAKKDKKMHWGLIWKKNNCEDTGVNFRLKNILLRGNPDKDLIKPICRLCNQPYNADLMYILCEACQHWFHADAVELDESKIFLLVGFKCCKCRRSKSPVCPYLDPKKKKALEDKMERQQAAKGGTIAMGSDSGIISENHKEVGPANSVLPRKAEVIHVRPDNPLLVPISDVKQHTEYKPTVDNGSNNATVSGPGPRKLPVRRTINPSEANIFNSTEKLPVRRLIKKETNLDCHPTTNSLGVEVPDPLEKNSVRSAAPDSLSSQTQEIASIENFDDVIILDYDTLGCDDVEFEPQTYFSFNELLASDDGGHANANELPENIIGNWESSSVLQENGTLEISYDQEEPIISVETPIEIVPSIAHPGLNHIRLGRMAGGVAIAASGDSRNFDSYVEGLDYLLFELDR
ncbi:hypothetical protein DH2020_021094 [Rehmannia glutinosa]|uniref:Membrane-bound transcription factor PTM chromo domain-containing protein n=1 Tax=Rehmannia glutinosa TaxID=99300 RepID=A0ABR0WDW1_REHGL